MLTFILFVSCGGPLPEGWLLAEKTGGPTINYDVLAEPLPEIPLPNDQATRLDPSTPTGRRLNISEDAPTEYERRTRRSFNEMDGFGTYAPIMVSFDKPLDVADLHERMGLNHDFRDDAIFLLNVDQGCNRYGEEVGLDMGRGRYPATLYKHGDRIPDPEAPNGLYLEDGKNLYFDFDPYAHYHNILFEETNEDLNGNGVLDVGEDRDFDGVLDVANFIEPTICDGLTGVEYDRCVVDNMMSFYDRGANRLFLRPLWPLEQQCTYAVVLTKRLLGEDGKPVQSPFPYVNPQGQTTDVSGAAPFLARYGLSNDDIAFAWSFTTGSMTLDLETLRAGLYGHGTFKQLETEFPVSGFKPYTREELAERTDIEPYDDKGDDYLLDGPCSGAALTWLWGPSGLDEWPGNTCAVAADLAATDGIFAGRFTAPNFLVDRDGLATSSYPADNDEHWEINPLTGTGPYGESEVTFWCALPQELDFSCTEGNPEGKAFCKPYPVIMYAHGYGGSRAEISLHIGRHNAMGYAMCGLDAYGHGLNVWLEDPVAGLTLALGNTEFTRDGVPELGALLATGRDRDLNNDGLPDSGADMWTSDVFHTRDMVRQTVLEHSQFVRMLRHMDGENIDGHGRVLGDIDGDGQVDIGGPENTIGMWGISLGGIISGVLAGSEPSLDTVSPNAGGAGLTDITARQNQGGVPQAVVMPMIGQLVVGCMPTDSHQNPLGPGETGDRDCLNTGADGPFTAQTLRLGFISNDNAKSRHRAFGSIENAAPGDRVEIENLVSGEQAVTYVTAQGWFRTGIAADALDSISRRSVLGVTDNSSGEMRVDDPTLVGDSIEIRLYEGDTENLKDVVNSFEQEVEFQGSVYPKDSQLVVLQEGLGYHRNTPDFARFLAIAQSALSPADPGVWGAYTEVEQLDYSYDPYARGTNVLMMPTAGDSNVPASTGVAMGRVSGLLGSWIRDEDLPAEYGWRELFMPDERYGHSIDDELVAKYVIEGDPRVQRFQDNPVHQNVIYDIDNISDGTAEFSCGDSDWSAVIGENMCPDNPGAWWKNERGEEIFFPIPNPPPGKELRQNWLREDGQYDAFRIPLLRPAGQHGIYNAQSFREFDADAYMVNFTVRFLGGRAMDVSHLSGCDCSASTVTSFYRNDEILTLALGDRECDEFDLKVCEDECLDWGIITPERRDCEP